MTTKNFVVKNGITTGNITLDAATGNLVATNANLGNLATANFFTGALTTNAQPNITSVGTLTGLTVNGVSNFGPNGNVIITGGTSGQFLQTNGSGNLSWVTVGTSGISNGNSSVSVPVANGNIIANVDGNTTMTIASTGANITGYANISGNANVANLGTGGLITATGNVTGANLTTGGVVTATGNIDGGNLNTGGEVVATGNVTGANFNTLGIVSAYGNIEGGNLTTTGLITATGNITGGNIITGGIVTVTGNANVGNLGTAGLVIATGNVTGGNLTTAGLVSATGNVSGGNINATAKVVASTLESNVATGTAPIVVASTTKVTNLNADLLDGYDTDTSATANTVVVRDANANITGNNISGTLSTAAQPNVTSLGTLSSLDVTGNIVSSANVVTDLIVGKTSSITITATGSNQNINLTPTGTGTVNVGNFIISNVQTPVSDFDAATKKYVDDVAQGLNIHDAALAATTNTLATLTGGTITYNNGTAGVGATLTLSGSPTKNFTAANTFDGNVTAIVTSRILVKNETNTAYNGVYVVTSSTVLTRADDYNTVPEVEAGDFIFVQDGTTYNDSGWVQTTTVTTIGTDPIVFTQFSGAGTYTAGTGLSLNGTEFSIANTTVTPGAYGNGDYNATFTVNQQGQLSAAANVAITANAANLTGTTLSSTVVNSSLTSVGTLGSLAVTANVTAGNVYANSGTVGASLLTGTLTTASQPNVTSVGSLTSLTVTGNANVGNIGTTGVFATTLSATSNANVGNLGTGGLITATGNISGGNLVTTGAVNGGTLSVSGTTNLGAIGNVTITGGTSGQIIQTDGSGGLSFATISTSGVSNGTSSVTIPTVNGNINLTSAGNTSLVVTDTGANITGTVNASGNANVGNLGTGGIVTATGNVIGGNLVTAGNVQTENIVNITANTSIGMGNGSGIVAIYSAGNATQFAPSGQITLGGASQIVGGTFGGSGLTLGTSQTDIFQNRGGNVTVQVGTGGSIANTWTFAQDGSFTSSGNITTTANANVGNVITAQVLASANVTAPQLISNVATGTAPLIVTSTTQVANLNAATAGSATTAGTVTTNAQPNITSVGTLTSLAVTGDTTSGNVYANSGTIGANLLTGTLTTAAQPNVTSVGTLTNLAVTGNVTTGNVLLNGGLQSNRSNVSVTTNTVIDQFSPSTFRTAKYIISASSADGYQSVEALLVQDGTNSYITIYGSVCSNNTADIIDIASDINGISGNVTVYATAGGANTYVNLVASYIKT
jgi:hypothetical protein